MTNGEMISKGYNDFVAEQAQMFLLFAFWAVVAVATCAVVIAIRRAVRK